MIKLLIRHILSFTITIGLTNVYGQVDTARLSAYEDLSLKDLLNVKIVSVSKESELLFDAPLSASVVTREEILRTGCTSIMEALRLVPGLIVREQSNGNYDIQLRGMDNLPPNSAFDLTSNTTTLVMIDNRPIYSYFKGGTFWETFPISINDVEKIEVVRGPAAALYGPNAVNGVINIITKQIKKDGFYAMANTQTGSYHTLITNATVGYRFNKKLSMIASGNYHHRDRTQTSYYNYYTNESKEISAAWLNLLGDTIKNMPERYPHPELALKRYAGNIFLNYSPAAKVKINFAAGAQNSMAQRVSTENEITPLSTAVSQTKYADLRINANNISAQASFNSGTQSTDNDPGNKYEFNNFDANLEYNYTRGKLSIKPGLSYRSAIYDDTKYANLILKNGILNGERKLTIGTASLRADYKLLEKKLRLAAGLRADKFNYPDKTYFSYQLAATYKHDNKNLFRAVVSGSPRSASIFDTYVDQTIRYFPSGYNQFTRIALEGNKNLKLLTAKMFEVGYRGKLTNKLNIDVEIFNINAKNYNNLVTAGPYVEVRSEDTIRVIPFKSLNIPMELTQNGATVSLTYSSKKLTVKPFATFQFTKIKNYSEFNNTPDAIPGFFGINNDPTNNNIYSAVGEETDYKNTPSVFGGASVNYMLTSKINFNINGYYYSSQTYQHLSNNIFHDGIRGVDHIKEKLILNTTISYEPVTGLHFFCTAKNILNNKSREFFHTDCTPIMLLAGLHYEF
ncbi:MAG: TonB-dependent receptor plug domain-containing protein [Ginsengibacter sp.]